jgi:hypothetical protein
VTAPTDRRAAYVSLALGMLVFGGTWPAGTVAAERAATMATST